LDIALCAHVAVALLPFTFRLYTSYKVDCTNTCSVLLIQHVYKIIQVDVRCQWHRNILSLWEYCSMLMHHWIMLMAHDTSHHLSWQTSVCSM